MDLVWAEDRGQRATDDEILLATATAEGRALLTNDTDFIRIHSEWTAAGRRHAGIVFWAQELPIGEAIRRILRYASQTTVEGAASALKFL
jgi:hypothetical protein